MANKIYLIKFSLVSFVFSIIILVTHLLSNTDLLFIKKNHIPESDTPLDKNVDNPHPSYNN